jgi:hypothetical protein
MAAPVFAVSIGLADTFEDGTTQGWTANPLGMGSHPEPPANVGGGGPDGGDDNYLRITAFGGQGAGSHLTALNSAQWAGDYFSAGITAIKMDVINLGTTDLFLRLMFEDPTVGPPENIAFSSDPVVLSAGSGWTPVAFSTRPAQLTAGLGDVLTALSNTTFLRLYHSVNDNFPNPINPIDAVVGQLGFDNITAVPEPATVLLFVGGLTVCAMRRRREPLC